MCAKFQGEFSLFQGEISLCSKQVLILGSETFERIRSLKPHAHLTNLEYTDVLGRSTGTVSRLLPLKRFKVELETLFPSRLLQLIPHYVVRYCMTKSLELYSEHWALLSAPITSSFHLHTFRMA